MKSENDDKKIVAQHIYTYYHNKRKKAVMRNEKVTVTTKDAEEWLSKIDGKESITILKKALELANGQDSVPIVIDNNSELRMLFMTGNGYKDRENNANQKIRPFRNKQEHREPRKWLILETNSEPGFVCVLTL